MARLVDADKVAEAIAWLDEYDFALWHDVQECIDKVPTVDAEPVRHGHWIYRQKSYVNNLNDSTAIYECSECGYADEHEADIEVPYCWHCGAKMQGDNDGNK